MRYPQLRRRRHPLGSGPVETACKYLIGTRFKQPGMCWSRSGAEAILCLRTALPVRGMALTAIFNNCYQQLMHQLRPAA